MEQHENTSHCDNSKMPKKTMTDEERLALAAQLDKELDDFIDNLPKRNKDCLPIERWEEELLNHPFFMKEPPKPGENVHPLFEGLQRLKYDPEENEPEELATNYKTDGNFNFKHKNYRLAILSYTEGLKVKCGNPEIEATLLNNRAAAHYFLHNYRSALKDCELSLTLKPDYEKAIMRAANCCYEMKQFHKGIEYCDMILEKNKDHKLASDLRKTLIQAMKDHGRNARKKLFEEKRKEKEEQLLINEIRNRGYKIEGDDISLEKLEPCFPQLVHNRVSLDESGNLVWPVVFVYPEYKVMDYIQQFSEETTLYEQLLQVFEVCPEWDADKKYKAENINVYYETQKKKIINVKVHDTLKDVLKSPGYIIKGGTPSFIILVRNSAAEKRFLEEY